MTTLSVQDIGLRPAQLRAIEKKARYVGKTAPQYVRALVEQDLLADKSFDEILRPIRHDFENAEITETQLDKIVQRARSASRPTKPRKSHR
jgi:hypothetical protein